MSIITISRGSYSRGRDVAEKLAHELGYLCVSREVILEASDQFNVPEAQLVRAVHDAPSVLDRYTYGKEKYLAYVRAALLQQVQHDDVVYHGFAGHFFLQEVPGVLKVRITAGMEDRINEVVRRDETTPEQARTIIEKDDEERRKWSLHLYGVDTRNSELYDLALNISNMTVENAVELIAHNARLPCFQITDPARRVLDDLTLAARVQALLIDEFPSANTSVKDGKVFVSIKGALSQKEKHVSRVQDIAESIEGVRDVQVHFVPVVVPD